MTSRSVVSLLAALISVSAMVAVVGVSAQSKESTRFSDSHSAGQLSGSSTSQSTETSGHCDKVCSGEKCLDRPHNSEARACCAEAAGSDSCPECKQTDDALKPEGEIILAQGPPFGRGMGRGFGRGAGRGRGRDEQFAIDHEVFFFLLDHRDQIRRTVKNLPNGIETLTESDDEAVAAKIQEHVAAMYDRVEEGRPIHMRDPLFREIFASAKKIVMEMKETDKGILVKETSTDPYVAALLHEHGKVVSLFLKNGREELHRNHPLPPRKPTSRTVDGTQWHSLPQVAPAPKSNPTTAAKVELGKKLYFDPRLSLTGTVSCNTCHNVMEGGDDGRPSSMGIMGRIGPRNAPTVWNSAFQSNQFWDGRSPSLEDQAKGPLLAEPEMGMPSHDFVIERIASIPGYVSEFEAVFGQDSPLNIDNTAKAIAAFERTLITPNSQYDRFVSGDDNAMSDTALRGLKLFASIGCTECHSGPAFNNWEPGATHKFQQFPRNADSQFVSSYKLLADTGRAAVTNDDEDRHHYKVPTLRNISLTAPYFHNGSVASLAEAVRVMGDTQLDTQLENDGVRAIVAFLGTLEGLFPEITMPRIPSMDGDTVLKNQSPAATTH